MVRVIARIRVRVIARVVPGNTEPARVVIAAMNWKSTIVGVVLAGAAGLWFFRGDEWGPRWGLGTAEPEPPPSPSVAVLDALTPAAITRVEVVYPAGEPLVLDRTASGSGWAMPGNWPVRVAEVERLVETLGTLRTRFHPLPLDDDLARFGLAGDQRPITVKLVADGRLLTLTFGQPDLAPGETSLTRPTFVRVDDFPEVLKLGPDVLPVVRRPADAYRRRQLFPDIERVRIATPAVPSGPGALGRNAETGVATSLPGERTEFVTVSRPVPRLWSLDLSAVFGGYTLVRSGRLPDPAPTSKGGEPVVRPDRLADVWRLTAPVPAPADPAKLRAALAVVADLWVEQFVAPDAVPTAWDGPAGLGALVPSPLEPILATAVRLHPDPIHRSGLHPDRPAVTVRTRDAEPVTVRFGGLARITKRTEEPEPGSFAPPEKVRTVYRYAQVVGNPQLFVVADRNLSDLIGVYRLADPQVARFTAEEVREVTVSVTGGPTFTLRRTHAADPDASDPDARRDRWQIDAQPNPLAAETNTVADLLDRLSRLSAEGDDRVRYPESPGEPRVVVHLRAAEKRPAGAAPAPVREYRLAFGPPEAAGRRLPVWRVGQPRVCLVDNWLTSPDPDAWITPLLFPPDTLAALLSRPAIAYRAKKLFDYPREALVGIITGGFELTRVGDQWRLTKPYESPADPAAAATLAEGLAGLTAAEFLTEAPTPEELKSYGLDRPSETVRLAFRDGRTYTLELGGPRPGKEQVYARLDGGGVLTLAKTAADPLARGVLGLLPRQVWAAAPGAVTAVEVVRSGDAARDSFTLTRDGPAWKLTGPFTAPVPEANARPLLDTLAALTTPQYHALTATNPAELGFDAPHLTVKLTYTEPKADGTGETTVRKTLVVGRPTSDGSGRYGRLDEPNAAVFIVPQAFVAAAETRPLDLPERNLLNLDPQQVVAVRVAAEKPDDSVALVRGAVGRWTAEGAAFAIDPERIRELTTTVARPPVIRLAAYGEAINWAEFGLDKPAVTVTLTTGGDRPETHTLALGKPDPTASRFARVDQTPAVLLIPAGAVETLTRKRFDYADRSLLSFDPTTLTGLTRTRDKEELELVPGAGIGWDLVKPARHKADAELMDELAAALGRLRAERMVAFGKREDVFRQYGLEPAAAVLTVTAGERAETRTLRIGNPVDPSKPDGERYVAVESAAPETLVGVLPARLAQKLLAPAVAFRDRTLAKFVDADKAILERPGRKITFTKTGATWKVTEPLAAAAESGELEALVADLGNLRVATWVAEKTGDLKPFGLDAPEAKWSLFDGDKPVLVLLVGRKTPDGQAHVATESGELVGLLPAPLTNRVLAEYRQRRPWEVDAAQVETVTVTLPGGRFTFRKAGTDWTDADQPGEPPDPAAVNELVGTLGGLRVDRYAADHNAALPLFGLDKPEATISVSERNGTPRVLEIGAVVGGSGGKQRYARVVGPDRSDVFVLTQTDTARLLRSRSEYAPPKGPAPTEKKNETK